MLLKIYESIVQFLVSCFCIHKITSVLHLQHFLCVCKIYHDTKIVSIHYFYICKIIYLHLTHMVLHFIMKKAIDLRNFRIIGLFS